ncbi:hypothetical protein ACFFJT_18605 [Dyella flava]|uniref:Uncharacterized protein n=1 Tax=Dyella flava TaxID=1920170 RepID=A0ABS2K983_9GAMM|nr:hypothetical protein [Dyella flava]MBM7127300.1 hypothetical protein [Dyella flava]GLQ52117.1 hypothetical protein GCM10010872_35660 [Dyella flava]
MRNTWLVLGLLMASQSVEAVSLCYVDFINEGEDSVVAISLATPGRNDWKPVTLRGVVNGGYVSVDGGYMGRAMVGIRADRGCVYDVLVEFARQNALLVKAFDVCHTHALYIERTWQQAHLAA